MLVEKLPTCLVLILCLSGTLYAQNTDAETQRIRDTIRLLNEGLVRRDRLDEIEREHGESKQLFQMRLDLAVRYIELERERSALIGERLKFLATEKVPALVVWGLAWRDAYQAAQRPKRKAWCLWLCKRARQLPPPPVRLEPPT